MEYFSYLSEEEKEDIFYLMPSSISRKSSRSILSYGLGATLYMPALREKIAQDIISKKIEGLVSLVICLEDAIGDQLVKQAEKSLISHIKRIAQALDLEEMTEEDLPFIFIRIRGYDQMRKICELLGKNLELITGFVFPKFSPATGERYLEELKAVNKGLNSPLYAMPVLETDHIIYQETRIETLLALKEMFDRYRNEILNIRIGATDFSSLFGIRRSIDYTIYDIGVIRHCISDIVNIFTRAKNEYVVSGPVWEYFPHKQNDRQSLLKDRAIEGIIREGILDQENGLTGKTIIHPTQIKPVQALQVVSYESYMDACSILSNAEENNGAIKSHNGNKMNEVKPHLNWAKKIMLKSMIYGVFYENKGYIDLLNKK